MVDWSPGWRVSGVEGKPVAVKGRTGRLKLFKVIGLDELFVKVTV
jgi:hypothetical protein